jgi:leucyl aminopeptidase
MISARVSFGKAEEHDTELLAIGIFEEKGLDETVKAIDKKLNGTISNLIKNNDFKGKPGEVLTIYPDGKIKAKRLVLCGLGKLNEFELDVIRDVAGKVAKITKDKKIESFTSTLLGEGSNFGDEEISEAIVEGSSLALYSFDKYKSEKDEFKVKEVEILLNKRENLSKVKNVCEEALKVCEAVYLARDIANTPSSDIPPRKFAELAYSIAKEFNLNCIVFGKEELEKQGMGGILSVGKGSNEEPMLIILEYNGADKEPIVIIGKAVTFDSGGISIKPSEKMDEMKFDKSGGAAAIAIVKAVAILKLPLKVIAIVPAVENLPSGSAYKPGDIVKFYNGKTAEIINTDAEGRLILADALAYATKNYNPKLVVDLATLTGACVVALGNHASGLFANDEKYAKKLFEIGSITGEKVWQLPLWKEYKEQIKSEVADIKNTGGRWGGAITAACFLSYFVNNKAWVHLDIAGTAWIQESSKQRSYTPKGATGVGVRLITKLLKEMAKA